MIFVQLFCDNILSYIQCSYIYIYFLSLLFLTNKKKEILTSTPGAPVKESNIVVFYIESCVVNALKVKKVSFLI